MSYATRWWASGSRSLSVGYAGRWELMLAGVPAVSSLRCVEASARVVLRPPPGPVERDDGRRRGRHLRQPREPPLCSSSFGGDGGVAGERVAEGRVRAPNNPAAPIRGRAGTSACFVTPSPQPSPKGRGGQRAGQWVSLRFDYADRTLATAPAAAASPRCRRGSSACPSRAGGRPARRPPSAPGGSAPAGSRCRRVRGPRPRSRRRR